MNSRSSGPAAAAILRTVLGIGRRTTTFIATLAFLVMFGLFGWGIWNRFVIGIPLRWTDEAIGLLFVWIVFGAAALVLTYRDHIAVGVVYDATPPGGRRWMQVLGMGAGAVILLGALPTTVDYIAFLWREKTPALMVRHDRAFSIFAVFQFVVGLRLAFGALAALIGRPLDLETLESDE